MPQPQPQAPAPSRPLPWTVDATDTGSLRVTDAAGSPVYAGPDHEDVLARVEDMAAQR